MRICPRTHAHTHVGCEIMDQDLSQKILHYEEFLNERLRSDLHKVLSQREKVCEEIAEYNQLKNTVDLLHRERLGVAGSPLKTMVDLGCNFYAHAKVEDCSRIFVSVGLGFYLEMELDEASAFIEKKVTNLSNKLEELSEQAAQINGRVKLVMETLRELQFSALEPAPSIREVW